MISNISLTIILMMVIITNSHGQDLRKPNFSGTWKVDITRSDFGPFPRPKAFVRTIRQDGIYLEITDEAVDRDGRRGVEVLRLTLDGEESINDVNGSKVSGVARAIGSHVLTQTSHESGGTRFVVYEIWGLSNAGETLIVEGEVASSMGEEDIFVVLNRHAQ